MDKIQLQKIVTSALLFSRALSDIVNHLERESKYMEQPFTISARACLKEFDKNISELISPK